MPAARVRPKPRRRRRPRPREPPQNCGDGRREPASDEETCWPARSGFGRRGIAGNGLPVPGSARGRARPCADWPSRGSAGAHRPSRAGHELLLRSTAFRLTHPEADPPARPGAPKPAAERPSIGAARPREATGHRRSAVLPFAAMATIWAAGGTMEGRREESPTQAYRPAARPFVPPRRLPEQNRSRPPVEDEFDRALRLRTVLARDQERAPFRMGDATARTLGFRPIQSLVHPQRFHILRLSGHARRRIE
jgi:hypothetical protein